MFPHRAGDHKKNLVTECYVSTQILKVSNVTDADNWNKVDVTFAIYTTDKITRTVNTKIVNICINEDKHETSGYTPKSDSTRLLHIAVCQKSVFMRLHANRKYTYNEPSIVCILASPEGEYTIDGGKTPSVNPSLESRVEATMRIVRGIADDTWPLNKGLTLFAVAHDVDSEGRVERSKVDSSTVFYWREEVGTNGQCALRCVNS